MSVLWWPCSSLNRHQELNTKFNDLISVKVIRLISFWSNKFLNINESLALLCLDFCSVLVYMWSSRFETSQKTSVVCGRPEGLRGPLPLFRNVPLWNTTLLTEIVAIHPLIARFARFLYFDTFGTTEGPNCSLEGRVNKQQRQAGIFESEVRLWVKSVTTNPFVGSMQLTFRWRVGGI